MLKKKNKESNRYKWGKLVRKIFLRIVMKLRNKDDNYKIKLNVLWKDSQDPTS